jgi:flagellar basal body-associated protein FliL
MKSNKLLIVQIIIMIILILLVLYTGHFYFTETSNYKRSHEFLENSVYQHEKNVNNYISLKEGLENEN